MQYCVFKYIIRVMKNILLFTTLLFSGFIWGQKTVKWASLNMTNPANQYVTTISAVDSQVVWGACWKANFTGNEVFRTVDGGVNYDLFQLPTTASNALIYQVFAMDADTAFVAVSNANGNNVEGLYRTQDGGTTWSLVFDSGQEGLAVFQVHFFDGAEGVFMGNTLTGGVNSIFFHTQDGGDSWTKSTTEFSSPCLYLESAGANYAAVGDSIWYAGGIKNLIFRSIDRGKTWTSHQLPAGTNASVLDIAFKNSLEGLALSSFLCGVGDTDNLIYKTLDGGETWSYLATIKFPFNLAEANNLTYIPGSKGDYITTSGVEPGNIEGFLTRNDGQSWTPVWAPAHVFIMEFLSPTLGFAGTYTRNGGLLSFQDNLDSLATSIRGQIRFNDQLVLFPNPTSDRLFLELTNGWRGKIDLDCYDMQGKKVLSQKLLKTDEKMNWEISLEGYPGGRYQVIISDGRKIVTKPFIKW